YEDPEGGHGPAGNSAEARRRALELEFFRRTLLEDPVGDEHVDEHTATGLGQPLQPTAIAYPGPPTEPNGPRVPQAPGVSQVSVDPSAADAIGNALGAGPLEVGKSEEPGEGPTAAATGLGQSKKVLVFATRWELVRDMCRGFAEAGHKVYVRV